MKGLGFYIKLFYDFTNILLEAFMCTVIKSTKNAVKPSVFFALLGSVRVKDEPKMLVKLTTVVNFISISKNFKAKL